MGKKILRIAFMTVIMAILTVPAGYAASFQVPGDYPNILEAYWAAQNGDTIYVKPGVYHGDGWCEVQLFGKSVSVIGEAGAANTIIDGWGVARGFSFREIPSGNMVVEGFTFRDCVGSLVGAVNFFRNSSITFRNCVVIRGGATSPNPPGEGGGIRIWGSSPLIEDVIIEDCYGTQGGGFNILEGSFPVIRRVVVRNNQGSGAQISTNCGPVFEDCQFIGNTSTSLSWSAGVGVFDHSDATVFRRCIISDNHNVHTGGGGVRVEDGAPTFINCMITGNSAAAHGGGVLARSYADPLFLHCTIAGNSSGDPGAGVGTMVYSNPQFHGCIMWNPAGEAFYSENHGGAVTTYCDINMSFPGEGNINADPLFSPDGTYHLTQGSPCLNRVPDLGVTEDFEGDYRPLDGGGEMGADEFGVSGDIYVELGMPSHMFYDGETCSLTAHCFNTGSPRSNMMLLVALGVYGEYFFWPGWQETIDSEMVDLLDPETEVPIIPEFPWPAGVGDADGIFFYSILMDKYMTRVYGDLAAWEFGWRNGPRPTPTATVTPTATATPTPEDTPAPSPTATATPDWSPTPTPDNSPTPSPTITVTPDWTSTPSPEPTLTPTPDPTNTPDWSPTPSPNPTFTPSPTPTTDPSNGAFRSG